MVETSSNSAKDHVLLGQAYAVNLETHSQLTASPSFLGEAVLQYNLQRQGILTNPGADFVGELMQRRLSVLGAKFAKSLDTSLRLVYILNEYVL